MEGTCTFVIFTTNSEKPPVHASLPHLRTGTDVLIPTTYEVRQEVMSSQPCVCPQGTPWPLVLSRGYPLVLSQVLPGRGGGYPSPARTGGGGPGQESKCCYDAGGTPLVVTREDFLVMD